jgi:hypothetical protein
MRAESAQQRFWYVWKKISPCEDTRQDWYTVAQQNPGGLGSPNVWQLVSKPIDTFATAMTEADADKMGPGFESSCCRDWSVFKNSQTGGFSVGRTDPASGPQPGQLTMVSPSQCCETAFNMAFGVNVGQIRDCRNLQLSTGVTVTLRPNGVFEPIGGGMGSVKTSTALNGTTLTYYPKGSAQECQSDCQRNARCKGFTWIHAGTYNAGDPAMCYLLSAVTGTSTAKGHTSAVKAGTSLDPKPGPKPPDPQPISGHWALQSVTVSPETPPRFEASFWSYSKQSTSAQFSLGNNQSASFQWSPPPQQVDGNGFTISINAQSPKFESTMGVTVSGLQGENIGFEVGPVHSPTSKSKSTTFKPYPNSSELEVKVSLAYGAVSFVYKYRRAQ